MLIAWQFSRQMGGSIIVQFLAARSGEQKTLLRFVGEVGKTGPNLPCAVQRTRQSCAI